MLRCPECRSRRTTFKAMQAHIKATGHKLCHCGGYHYAHRPMSPFCEANPKAGYHHAHRHGADSETLWDVLLDMVLNTPGRPFNSLKQADRLF